MTYVKLYYCYACLCENLGVTVLCSAYQRHIPFYLLYDMLSWCSVINCTCIFYLARMTMVGMFYSFPAYHSNFETITFIYGNHSIAQTFDQLQKVYWQKIISNYCSTHILLFKLYSTAIKCVVYSVYLNNYQTTGFISSII